jgi:hypothetical protein
MMIADATPALHPDADATPAPLLPTSVEELAAILALPLLMTAEEADGTTIMVANDRLATRLRVLLPLEDESPALPLPAVDLPLRMPETMSLP